MTLAYLTKYLSGLFWLSLVTTMASVAAHANEIDFNKQIRPILSQHCLACHGPDESQRQAGFRIDVYDEAIAAIEPGDPDNSEVFLRIISEDDDRMPPLEHGGALSKDEIELIENWISEGAQYNTHWAFVLPSKAEPPPLGPSGLRWARNEIDHFVGAKLNQKKLEFSADAEPRRLIRRVALDLTGLPPSRQLVERFAQLPNDETYASIVDELLASPAYGEHWTAMWLDMARYADTSGYAEDKHRTIWPWRDWVIRAFDSNMPFDQFTTEQIAGDLLPNATADQLLATAFHRNTLNNSEGGTDDEEFRVIAVKDRINTTMNVWMGLTLRCAECHSHKYDPISHTEYYRFLAFFNQTIDSDKTDDRPHVEVYPDGRELEFAKLDSQIETLETEIAESELSTEDESKSKLESLQKKLAEKTKQRSGPLRVPVMAELSDGDKRTTHVMTRGSYLQPADEVSASVLGAFHQMSDDSPRNRLGVAHWLVSPDNPLTARVTVNRYWARLFGTGIVETEEDFGTQGSQPTHPELLDWLAVDFRENGWNLKRLLKQMVTSTTYRQSAVATKEGLEKDPHNLYLSRGPRFRLSAEVVRDQALAVSGLLNLKKFGAPVFPSNPVKKVRSAFQGETIWIESEGEDRFRRTLYTYLKRTSPHPLFETFDIATREVCNLRRIRTNTPLQSFMTLNGRTFLEAAQALAVKMNDHSDQVAEQIKEGVRRALLRPCTDKQLKLLMKLYAQSLEQYRISPQQSQSMIDAMSGFGVDAQRIEAQAAELASLTVVANVILNLDSFLTR